MIGGKWDGETYFRGILVYITRPHIGTPLQIPVDIMLLQNSMTSKGI